MDKVRASRDGHEFHEAWAARKSLQLLLPSDNLIGIAIEGLSPTDHSQAKSETVEIADVVLYYGKRPTFKGANTVNIVQCKYSVSHSNVHFRNSHAKKTIEKFAIAFLDHIQNYGKKDVQAKLNFELITNRPIYPAFEQAIANIAGKKALTGEVKKQAEQFKAASGLKGTNLVEFASKCQVTGLAGSLSENKRCLSRTIVDWSATADDPMARSRLAALKNLVRGKAGSEGDNKNIIRLTDVLDALDVQDENDLLPCPASFPNVGEIVEREQLNEVIALIPKVNKPILVHAAGGVGKTVFLESLAKMLSANHEVVLFDCFGGGAYRALDDARHLPKHGLVHIANTLAFNSLCDPLLPGSENKEALVKTFRRRLVQCVKTIRRAAPNMEIVLIIDAIDNAAEHACEMRELSFPKVLLESFHYNGSISGVRYIVACRTERIALSKGDVDCFEFQLKPFSLPETEHYLRGHLKKVTQTEIQVAQARSGGNARILEHLATSDRGLIDTSEINNPITLDHLLKERVNTALSEARTRGYKKSKIDAFLAGLAVLPPPVPLEEYASAHGMDLSAIESFAADLAPLLERTKYGLMFRDEPTETFIKKVYSSDLVALRRVAKNLMARQGSSVYASRSLPGLLQRLNDGKQLFKLAFDVRFPESITSNVGKRNIQYARLKAATLHASHNKNYNQLVHLLVELSKIAAVDQRGTDYILDYPDLVITAQDVDAMRRLFETRTKWPGSRHARLAIANTLSGDLDDAYRHAVRVDEWIHHYRQNNQKQHTVDESPDRLDIASIPFCLITQNRAKSAVLFMSGWKDWYCYEVSKYIFSMLEQTTPVINSTSSEFTDFLDNLTDEIGIVTAVLSYVELNKLWREKLIKQLSKSCSRSKNESDSLYSQNKEFGFRTGLLKAGAIAISMGLFLEARKILNMAQKDRPSIWSFRDTYSDGYVFPFLSYTTLMSVANGKNLQERNILPKDLIDVCGHLRNTGDSSQYMQRLKKKLDDCYQISKEKIEEGDKSISYEQKQEAERFINERLEPLFKITKAFSGLLGSPHSKVDEFFVDLLKVWAETSKKHNAYIDSYEYDRFFQLLGSQIAIFSLWVRSDLATTSVKLFMEYLTEQKILNVQTNIKVVEILAKRYPLHSLAGEQAIKTKNIIEQEDEVVYRTSLFAQLGRAIAPASIEEAAAYFRTGLEQMDAIGSGDYVFTNELLLFASSLKGNELEEQDFHILTNICELNMSCDEEKFPWYAYANGLSRTSGGKGLAKLARWDDRLKVSLDYTLLPYLTALVDDDKIIPDDAISILKSSNPVELYSCDTSTFAKVIDNKNYPNSDVLVSELIQQFEDNNSGVLNDKTVKYLALLAKKTLGKKSDTTKYLIDAYECFGEVRVENNENINYRGKSDDIFLKKEKGLNKKNQVKLKRIIKRTIISDYASMENAVDELNEIQYSHNLKDEFFVSLRTNLEYSDRSQYLNIVARLNNLGFYIKLDELQKCKEEWGKSSVLLTDLYESLGMLLIQFHAEDFLNADHLSGYQLKNVSDLSGVSIEVLTIELIKLFTSLDWDVPASVWLGLASFVIDKTKKGEGQAALSRLLKSDAAKLASSVTDGKWKKGLYPPDNRVTISAGFTWRMLGSPKASDRWRAAHSVRCFANFKRWKVVDALISRINNVDAHPFQAPELPFFFLHARLWLLIALARIAMDYPKEMSKHRNVFKRIILDKKNPHVLMRHFAAQALLACVEKGTITLTEKDKKQVKDINVSPFPRLKKKTKKTWDGSFYHGRPKGVPEPKYEFSLDYDFEKYDVKRLSDVFGKPGWEVKDMIAKAVRKYDKKITHMYDDGGREVNRYDRMRHMSGKYHTFGHYLGWHALFTTAGQLLMKHPVTNDSYEYDPWEEFMKRSLLTRCDGLWLADGLDRQPLGTIVNLLEKGDKDLILTGNKTKILHLINIGRALNKETIVEGSWSSPDDIKVQISSALVPTKKARKLAKNLIQDEPFLVWVPTLSEYEDEQDYYCDDKKDFIPWIIRPSTEVKLDEYDPLGSANVMRRSYFSKSITSKLSLKAKDPFGRNWISSTGKSSVQSLTWGHDSDHDDGKSSAGSHLACSDTFLTSILTTLDLDLLILVNLQRFTKGIEYKNNEYSNTIAVIRIKKSLEFEYFKGQVNKKHKSTF